ncbi:helix-turn-helix transcriptional regulator [Labrenzia sp. DG1229]|uniref:helix-turn-helix domain-containing protein n=1 Tax=Labrenzia sp. DG1229 TaxID=681847 RepID=UPI00048FA9D3|nr:helix-turn-helix transcriptional regulator [Labrenzia sp. DG1229]
MFAINDIMSEHWKINLRQVIESKGVYMNELSKQLGHNESYITQLLNKSHTPSVKTLAKIAEKLGVPVSDLMGSGEPSGHSIEQASIGDLTQGLDLKGAKVSNVECFREAYREAMEIMAAAKEDKSSRIDPPALAVMVLGIYAEKIAKTKGE